VDVACVVTDALVVECFFLWWTTFFFAVVVELVVFEASLVVLCDDEPPHPATATAPTNTANSVFFICPRLLPLLAGFARHITRSPRLLTSSSLAKVLAFDRTLAYVPRCVQQSPARRGLETTND